MIDNPFKIDDRVVYAHNTANYTTGQSNPLVGTKYECEGTVINIEHRSVRVEWDNGRRNVYNYRTLELVSMRRNNPNIIFRRKKKGR